MAELPEPVKRRLAKRKEKKWDSFSWITLRALISSVNHVLNLAARGFVGDLRAEWEEHHPVGDTELWTSRRIVDRRADESFIVLGDPGEQDASQYVVVPALEEKQDEADFMVVMSDVIYPSGDVNDYVDGYYVPYEGLKDLPTYALPGNHDWYDGLTGFMWHFCGAAPLPRSAYGTTSRSLREWLGRMLWRRPSGPRGNMQLDTWRAKRTLDQGAPDVGWEPLQPGPYFAIDTAHLRIVCIDTGIQGEIDAEQARWLLEVSKAPDRPKVLLTGKPLYVNRTRFPCPIAGGPVKDGKKRYRDVATIVEEPGHGYVASIGGDIHNFQHYWAAGMHHVVAGGGGAYMSATHFLAGAESGPYEPEALDPTEAESLQLFAGLLLPMLWRLERAIIALIAGLAGVAIWVGVASDDGPARDALPWAAIALGLGVLFRAALSPKTTRQKPYRFFAVVWSLLAGAVIGLAGSWLVGQHLSRSLIGVAALAGGGIMLAALIRATGWWRRREPDSEIPKLWRFGAALLVIAPLAVALVADAPWQVTTTAGIVAAAAIAGWWLRGLRKWPGVAYGVAIVAQTAAALLVLDAWVVPAAAHDAFGDGVVYGLLLGVPFVLVAMLVALIVVDGLGALALAWRTGIHAAWGYAGGVGRSLLALMVVGAVWAWWHMLGGLPTDSRRAAVAVLATLIAPVAAGFGLDIVRRRFKRPRWLYKVVVVFVLGALLALLIALDASHPWIPRAVVAGAVALALALGGTALAHLGFVGALWLPFDRASHKDGEDPLDEAQAKEVVALRRRGAKPPRGWVRLRANLVMPQRALPHSPIQEKVAELCDTDAPPFRKGFLVVHTSAARITIQPWVVTGAEPAGTTCTAGTPIVIEVPTPSGSSAARGTAPPRTTAPAPRPR